MLSHHLSAGKSRNIKTVNRSFENVDKFKYLGTTVTNRNVIQEEIERRLNSDNACYDSVQKFLPSRLLCKNVENRIYKTIILSLVFMGVKLGLLTLREEHRLSVFENRVLWRIFGLMRGEAMGGWRKVHEELHNWYCPSSIIRMTKIWIRWACHVARMGRRGMPIGILWENQKEKDH
jgi:hypothetical protein